MLFTFIKLKFVEILYTIVETVPNFIKRKHPRKGENPKGQGQKFRQANNPKKGRPPRGKGITQNRSFL
jgi:hypothetical protein